MELARKVALVTGGAMGIGLAVAKALTEAGAQVVVADRESKAGKQSAAEIGALFVRADVAEDDELRRMIETAERFGGGLDIVVNNAGIGIFADVADMTPDQWREVIDTNLTGVFNVSHAAIPHLRRRGGGFIINISSLAGKNAFTTGGAYCASKSGLNAFSEALMQEVRYDNIRVSYVMPGSVATEFSGDSAKGADWKIAPDEVAQVVLDLLHHPARSLPSRVELRPSKPKK
jgi:3-oxoacyl-[acyl-carrier protein] reductase